MRAMCCSELLSTCDAVIQWFVLGTTIYGTKAHTVAVLTACMIAAVHIRWLRIGNDVHMLIAYHMMSHIAELPLNADIDMANYFAECCIGSGWCYVHNKQMVSGVVQSLMHDSMITPVCDKTFALLLSWQLCCVHLVQKDQWYLSTCIAGMQCWLTRHSSMWGRRSGLSSSALAKWFVIR
jgi:hypothetical protein